MDSAAAGGFDGPSGSLVGAADGSTRTAVGYAGVARGLATKQSPGSALGLTVVTTVRTERHGARTGGLRLALLAAAVLGPVPGGSGRVTTHDRDGHVENEVEGQRFDLCARQGLTPESWYAVTCAPGPIIVLSGDCYA